MGNIKWRLEGVCVVVLAFLSAGCDQVGQGPTGPAAKLQEKPVESTAAKTGQPPTDEECQEFAKKMEDAVARGDIGAFNALIDWDAILESATGGIPGVDSARRQFSKGVKQSVSKKGGLGDAILSQVAAGGTYDFLRAAKSHGKKCVRFRLVLPNGGLNYHDFMVVRLPNGQTKAIDMYVYGSGELTSKTLRRVYIPLVAHENRSVLEKLTGTENDFVKHLNQCHELVQTANSGQSKRALEIYTRLPESLQKDKNMLLMRFLAASQSGDEKTYTEAIDDFEKFHPNDSCLMLLSIDGYFLRKEYDKAIACVEQLDKAVGGDPYLQNLITGLKQAKKSDE